MKPLQEKKIVMIIAPQNFRDEEYQHPKDVLERSGAKVVTAGWTTDESVGMLGMKVKPDITLSDIRIDDYDAFILIGGSGAEIYWDDPGVQKLFREASAQGKVVGAICIAPVTLANAGILDGKKATCFPSVSRKMGEAIYQAQPVVRSGNIVTANGPAAAIDFAEKIKEALLKVE